MALDTVQQYVGRVRVLLQDTVDPFRYSTEDMVEALNMGILEARRIRPDIFLGSFRSSLPEFSPSALNASVPIDPMYRVTFVYYIAGHCTLRDDENNQDSRAAALLNKFVAQLLTTQA